MGNAASSTSAPKFRRKSESVSISNDLHRLALAKRAEDARQKAIEEKTHDVSKVSIINLPYFIERVKRPCL